LACNAFNYVRHIPAYDRGASGLFISVGLAVVAVDRVGTSDAISEDLGPNAAASAASMAAMICSFVSN
jgi:hypothetical protein